MTNKVESKTVRRFKLTGYGNPSVFKEGTFPMIITEEDVSDNIVNLLFVYVDTFKGHFLRDHWLDGSIKEFLFDRGSYVELEKKVLSEKETLKVKVDVLRFKQELMLRNISWNMKRLHVEQFKTANIFY